MTDSTDKELRESTGTEETRREEALMVDAAIMQMLNLRFEVADDIIKVWPREIEIPDDTNWLTGPRFTQSVVACQDLFEALKVETEALETDGEHFVRVTFPNHGGFKLDGSKTYCLEMAQAIALMSTLYIFRTENDVSHD
jgi:hypothetical protein